MLGENYYGKLGTGDSTNLNIPSAAINLGGKESNGDFSWRLAQLRHS